MVAATFAAGSGDRHRNRLRFALWHAGGLALGAAMLALAASALGAALPVQGPWVAVFLGAAAALWGAARLVGRPLPVLTSKAQVPRAWRYTLTPPQYLFSYGVGLGLGALTRVPTLSFYVFVGTLLMIAPNVLAAVLVAQCYALARAIPVGAALAGRRGAEQFFNRIGPWQSAAVRVDAVVLVAVGTVLIAFALV